jgi:hypothetical protein
MNRKHPQNSASRPNWYKIRLPPHLTKWAIKCLEDEVDVNRYQNFAKISMSCKNNGKTIFMRLLFESRLYEGGKEHGAERDLAALPVCYLIDVNKSTLKGNDMDYDIGNDVKYHEVYPVYNKTVEFDPDSKFNKEKYKLFKYINKFTVPLVGTGGKSKRR